MGVTGVATQLASPVVKDGLGKLLSKNDSERFRAIILAPMLQEAESLMMRHGLNAMQSNNSADAEMVCARLMLRIALHLAG